MSEANVSHKARNGDVIVATSSTASSAIGFGDMAGGTVYVGGVTATATLTCYGSSDGVTFAPVYGFDGQPATIAVAADGGASPLPDAVYPLRFVKLVSGTDLGTAASVVVSVKS